MASNTPTAADLEAALAQCVDPIPGMVIRGLDEALTEASGLMWRIENRLAGNDRDKRETTYAVERWLAAHDWWDGSPLYGVFLPFGTAESLWLRNVYGGNCYYFDRLEPLVVVSTEHLAARAATHILDSLGPDGAKKLHTTRYEMYREANGWGAKDGLLQIGGAKCLA